MKQKTVLFPGLSSTMGLNGDTYTSLGEAINMSASAIGRRMSGETEWTLSEIRTVCRYYGKTFSELFD